MLESDWHLRNGGFSLYLLPASLGTVFLVCGQQAHQNPGRMLHCVSWLSSHCCPAGTHFWVTYAPWFTSCLISWNNACVLLLSGWCKSTWDSKAVVVGVKVTMADFGTDCSCCFAWTAITFAAATKTFELQLLLCEPQLLWHHMQLLLLWCQPQLFLNLCYFCTNHNEFAPATITFAPT